MILPTEEALLGKQLLPLKGPHPEREKKILFNIDCSIIIPQAEGETTVLVAGDPERAHIQKVKEDGGIHYHVNLLEAMVC